MCKKILKRCVNVLISASFSLLIHILNETIDETHLMCRTAVSASVWEREVAQLLSPAVASVARYLLDCVPIPTAPAGQMTGMCSSRLLSGLLISQLWLMGCAAAVGARTWQRLQKTEHSSTDESHSLAERRRKINHTVTRVNGHLTYSQICKCSLFILTYIQSLPASHLIFLYFLSHQLKLFSFTDGGFC